MSKGIYLLFRTKNDYERHMKLERHITQTITLDHVTIALGRMGFRNTKFREFDRVLAEVVAEYAKDYGEDLKCDKEMTYSKSLMDREIKQYVGDMFKPWEERYG